MYLILNSSRKYNYFQFIIQTHVTFYGNQYKIPELCVQTKNIIKLKYTYSYIHIRIYLKKYNRIVLAALNYVYVRNIVWYFETIQLHWERV